MERKPAITFLLLALFLIGGTVILLEKPSRNVSNFLSSEGFSADSLKGFNITSKGFKEAQGIKIQTVRGVNGVKKLHLEIYSNLGAGFQEELLKEKEYNLKSVYNDVPAPYDRVHGFSKNCSETYFPKKIELNDTGESFYYLLYADGKQHIGACTDENVEYHVQAFMGYCETRKKALYAEVYTPLREEPRLVFRNISCE